MARKARRRRYTRTARRTRRTRRMGDPERGLMGAVINFAAGGATGAIQAVTIDTLKEWSLAIPATAIGVLAGNEALETIGGFETGKNLVNMAKSGSGAASTMAVGRY